MRNTALGVAIFLCAVGTYAGTISSLNPASVHVARGEHFVTVSGTDLGDQVTYSGPAGTFTVDINSRNATSVTAWIPLEVTNRAGRYSVTVRGGRTGDSGPASFDVIDPDRRFVLLLPEVLVISAISREGANVKFDLETFGGKEEGLATIECDPKSGSMFKLGSTLVRCSAKSVSGERAEGSFSVTVVDDEAPALKLPENIVVEATEPKGAIVKFDGHAFDAIDGELHVSCDRSSGSLFPVGRTTVACTATDFSSNPAYGTFTVDVKGKNHLALRVPDGLVAEAEGPDGAVVVYEVEAEGTEDPAPEIKCDPESGDVFKLGTTLVNCFASDRFGGRAEARFELSVADTVGPIIATAFTDPQYLVPVDKSMVTVKLDIEAVDLVDPFPRCSVVDVTANEQISPDDWKIVSDREVLLRATRNGGIDRIYRIGLRCTDERKNETTGTATAVVPASGEAPKAGSSGKTPGKRRAGRS